MARLLTFAEMGDILVASLERAKAVEKATPGMIWTYRHGNPFSIASSRSRVANRNGWQRP